MRNGNQVDFDICYKNINEAVANSEGSTDAFYNVIYQTLMSDGQVWMRAYPRLERN